MPSIAQMDSVDMMRADGSSPGMKKRKREYESFDNTQSNAQQFQPLDNNAHGLFYGFGRGDIGGPTDQLAKERILLKPRPMKPARGHEINKRRRTIPSSEGHVLGFSSLGVSSEFRQDNTHDVRSRIIPSVDVTNYPKADLSACHICHKRPRVKSDLDGYADCEGCGRRTCFICMRKCRGEFDVDDAEIIFGIEASLANVDDEKQAGNEQGEDGVFKDLNMERTGHRGAVCSRCAKECGPDGHVRCNGCMGLAWGG